MSTIEGFLFPQKKKIFYKIINTQFRAEGRPVLVFLHEGLGSAEQWRGFPELLSEQTQCAVLIYDRYGYGKSEACSGERPADFLKKEAFEYLPALLEACGIDEKIILFGHSDGGTIALLYASKYTDKTLALITEADHVLCEDITSQGVKDVAQLYNAGALKKFLQRFHGDNTESMFRSWFNYWNNDEIRHWHILDALPQITCPVLIIQGKNDNYGSVRQINEKMTHLGGHIDALYIANCGHVPHAEALDMVLDISSKFILRYLALIIL